MKIPKNIKIYRLLKKEDNKLTVAETRFLEQLYGMYNAGKHQLISKKQHSWADKILSK
jgi:hypothetical protein